VALLVGFIYAGAHLASDLSQVHSSEVMPFVLLGIALLVALGFEFVNGFHDTANAVATVIYTHSMEPHIAVVWSGAWNFIGVLVSSGAVAFGIVSLLPVELILQVGGKAGFSMVFALLIAAIIWNLGTWFFGLPASSSHTMVGSIIGVGIANQLMSVKSGTSGVDWGQATNIGKSLLLSPLVGFAGAALLLLLCKALIPNPQLYEAPKGTEPPPFWIRALLVLTCTGVSFAHGSNDGQKGMGLIMLILIGTVPTAYAVNHAVTPGQTADFVAVSTQTADVLGHYLDPSAVVGDSREEVTDYIRTKNFTPNTMLAMRELVNGIGTEMALYKDLKAVPQDKVRNFRNDMYVVSEGFRLMQIGPAAILDRGRSGDRKLQEAHRQRHEIHPQLGESGGGSGSGHGHDDRMEAHRRNRGRENRERSLDLWTRRGGRDHCNVHDRGSRLVRIAREHDARAVVGRGRYDGGKPHGPTVGHGAQSRDGVGADSSRLHHFVGHTILGVPFVGRLIDRCLADRKRDVSESYANKEHTYVPCKADHVSDRFQRALR